MTGVMTQLAFIDRTMAVQRAALRFQLCLACGTVIAGLIVIALTQVIEQPRVDGNLRLAVTLGGSFLSSLSGFPFKEMYARKDRIAALAYLREAMAASPPDDEAPGDAALQQQFHKLLERLLA